MKQSPLNQLPLRQKIAIAFCIPIMSTIIVSMFAIMGFKQIINQNHMIYEQIASLNEKQEHNDEILTMMKHSERRIQSLQIMIITITILSIIIGILVAFFMARIIHVQTASGLPEEARNDLNGIVQKLGEIIRKY